MENQQNTGKAKGPNQTGTRPGGPPNRGPGGPGGPRGRGPRGRRPEEKKEFDSRILDLARVTRVTKGGKRMRFRCCIVLGDRKGRVGYGVAKGADVQQAIAKSTNQAKKKMIRVPIENETIPHEIKKKFAAALVLIKPAPRGTGIKAGGAVRVILEFAGVPNVTAKILGSSNKINNAKATVLALSELKPLNKKKAREQGSSVAGSPEGDAAIPSDQQKPSEKEAAVAQK
ncbi:MAG: 30S ribosomal protein S5 [Patescibacteria group bacterium]|nr:30S ribosomal protein S5 [Patescibacteria group bacterium]